MSGEEKLPKKVEEEEDEGRRRGWLSWFIGWVAIPGAVIGLIVGSGIHVGARYPDMWFSKLVVWMFGGN